MSDRSQLLYPVANNSNRITSQGRAPLSPIAKTSAVITNIIAAGATLTLPMAGNQFYFVTASNTLTCRPVNSNGAVGVFVDYVQGTGMDLDLVNAFEMLEIKNNNASGVVFQVFIGFDRFIDNRLTVANQRLEQFCYGTYQTENSATSIAIADLSGTLIADINGTSFYAVYRVAIIVCNPSSSATLRLQKSGAATGTGPAAAAIYPLTSLRYDARGAFAINNGGGNINALVSEIYAGIAA